MKQDEFFGKAKAGASPGVCPICRQRETEVLVQFQVRSGRKAKGGRTRSTTRVVCFDCAVTVFSEVEKLLHP